LRDGDEHNGAMSGATVAAGSSPRLYQRVFDILEGQIRQGALPADAALTETAVAARFGVSRAPARRALEELAQAGIIEKSGAHGFVVAAEVASRPRGPAQSGVMIADDAPKLVSLPSWERIYGEVESEIAARISFATWRVNEAELARHYGVSRTVARDVIGRLQQRGLVQKDDRARWYAPALTAAHVGELYELRWLLEPVALVKAAPNLPDGLLSGVRSRLEVAQAQEGEVPGAVLDELEHDLHVTVLKHCRNRALMQAITLPQSLLIAHRFLYRWTSRMFEREPFLPEHLDIVARLETGAAAGAAAALEAHLRVSADRAVARIDVIARGSQPDPLRYLERLNPVG